MDPALAEDTISATIVSQIYETPLQYDYDSDSYSKLEPLLLKEMPLVSSDSKTFTLKLKDSILFHPDPSFEGGKTRKLKAQDLALSVFRILDPKVNSSGFWIFSGRLQGADQFRAALNDKPFSGWKNRIDQYFAMNIEGLSIVDDSTLVFKFNTPYPSFKYVLAMAFLAPVPREAIERYGDSFGDHAVGTGPFWVKSWRRNSKIVLRRNNAYWGEIPKVKGAVVEFILESQPYWLKFLQGLIDVIAIPKDQFDYALADQNTVTPELKQRGIELIKSVLPVIWYVGFNMKDPVVGNDLLLRRSIALAYDYKRRIEIMTNNRALRASTLIPPGIAGHEETQQTIVETNIDEARKLLSRSRYSQQKDPPPLVFDLLGNSTAERQWGAFFARDMAKLGVNVTIQMNSFAEYLEKQKTGRLQVFMGGWIADYPDPENFLQLLYSGNLPPGPNAANFSNQAFDQLFVKLRETVDADDRMVLIQSMTKIVENELPWIVDFYSRKFVLKHPWLKNYRIHPFCYNYFKYLELDHETKKVTSLSNLPSE